jgi:hypothetical protein
MVRANEHGKALNEAIDEFTERHPYAVVHDFKPEINYYVVRFKVREWPDPAWSPILGDIVHNMRSALDHLAWQLAIRNERNPASVRSQFPIFTRRSFDPSVYGGPERAKRARDSWENQTRGMHSNDIELLKLLQPYQRGEEVPPPSMVSTSHLAPLLADAL